MMLYEVSAEHTSAASSTMRAHSTSPCSAERGRTMFSSVVRSSEVGSMEGECLYVDRQPPRVPPAFWYVIFR